jgi:AraC-like DNA-binding protein
MATERIILATSSLAIGRFRCPPDDARWQRPNWIGPRHHVVFPARSVLIEQDGHAPVVADPNHVVLYDPGRTYHRELVSPDGDVATYVVVSEPLVRSLLGDGEPGGRAPRFGRPELTLAPEPLLRLQLLVRGITDGAIDALEAEEVVLEILDGIVRSVDGNPPGRPGSQAQAGGRHRRSARARTRDEHARLVLDARRLLAERSAEPMSLADAGRFVGASPFHLARLFRDATGQSMNDYREQIRLRRALDILTSPGSERSVAFLAAAVGFGSHAHFDTRFRRTFGRSPREIRAAVRSSRRPAAAGAALRDELRTIAKVHEVARA